MESLKKQILLKIAMFTMVWTAGAPITAIAFDQVSNGYENQAVNTYRATSEYRYISQQEREQVELSYKNGEIDEKLYKERIEDLQSTSHVSSLIKSGTDEKSKEILKTSETFYYTALGLFGSSLITGPIAFASFHKLNKSDDPSEKHYQDDDMEEAYHPTEPVKQTEPKGFERTK